MRALRVAAVCAIGWIAAWPQTDQKTSREYQTKVRGQTPVQDPHSIGPMTLHGILVDAGCPDRSSLNLRQPAESVSATAPAQPQNAAQNNPPRSGAVAAKGVTVDAQTVERERADAMDHQVPDMRSRQMDPTCAVGESTRGFAVLSDDGRLLDVDEGGNTLLWQAVQSSPAGRAMLNGMGPAVKPRVFLQGRLRGDRMIVEKILRME